VTDHPVTDEAVTDLVITNVRAVLENRILDDATVVVRGGLIVDVRQGGPAPTVAPHPVVDGRGAFLLPGLICTHSDGVEREIWPRPNTRFPVDFALRSFEGRLRAAGVTTVFHGVGFDDKPSYDRTVEQALELCAAIGERRTSGHAPAHHLILHRVEARSEHGFDEMCDALAASDDLDHLPLVSFEDHSPGQGQYRDIERFKLAIDPDRVPEGQTIDDLVTERLAEAEALAGRRDQRIATVRTLAADGRIRLLAHDLEDAREVAAAHDWGAEVAEFPLTVSAAEEARSRDMTVVMGAPNVLRGGSHSGNVAAADLVERGLCTALASDYQPSTMLAAVLRLADDGACTLPRSVALVTSGPARVAGLTDRGRIEPGLRADLTLVSVDGPWPRVRATFRAPTRVAALV
jgi:alpha-D-ribose 1-methylphosphonate 5-triphosphate diphosphatase